MPRRLLFSLLLLCSFAILVSPCTFIGWNALGNNGTPLPRQTVEGRGFLTPNGTFLVYGGWDNTANRAKNTLWGLNTKALGDGWKLISGDLSYTYGLNQYTAFGTSPTNMPPPRMPNAYLLDQTLWVTGGKGLRSTPSGVVDVLLNDLWSLDLGTKNLDWNLGDPYSATTMYEQDCQNKCLYRTYTGVFPSLGLLIEYGGHDPNSRSDRVVTYDTVGGKWSQLYGVGPDTPSSDQAPGSRSGGCTWTVGKLLYIFGGKVADNSLRNDIWSFNLNTNSWDKIKGNPTRENAATYGIRGVYDSTYMPGARVYSSCWKDSDGVLWLYGGHGIAGNENNLNFLSDLWSFDLSLRAWAYWGSFGDGTGKTDVPFGDTEPGGVRGHVTAWDDDKSRVLLTAGEDYAQNAIQRVYVGSFLCTVTTTLPPVTTVNPLSSTFTVTTPAVSGTVSVAPTTISSTSSSTTAPSPSSSSSSPDPIPPPPPTEPPVISNELPPDATIINGTLIVATRSLVLNETGTVALGVANSSYGSVKVQGCIQLNGTLKVVLYDPLVQDMFLPLITSLDECLNGSFSAIEVVNNFTSAGHSCNSVAEAPTDHVTFAVTIGRTRKCHKGRSRWIIAGSVVGAVALVLVCIALGLVLYGKIKQSKTLRWFVHSSEDSHGKNPETGFRLLEIDK